MLYSPHNISYNAIGLIWVAMEEEWDQLGISWSTLDYLVTLAFPTSLEMENAHGHAHQSVLMDLNSNCIKLKTPSTMEVLRPSRQPSCRVDQLKVLSMSIKISWSTRVAFTSTCKDHG